MILFMVAQFALADVSENCTTSFTCQEIFVLLKESEDAFRQMDTESFTRKRRQALDGLQCVTDSFTSGQVAQLHRIEVLHAFIKRDMALLGGHSRAANHANPDVSVVQGLIQEGHPLDVLSSFAVQEATAPKESVSKPIVGRILIDGREERLVPPDLPYVFQLVNANGEPSVTKLVPVGEPVPSYPTWRGESFQLQLEPRLTIAAGATAAVAITTMSIAYFQEQKFWNPSTSLDELEVIRKRNNQLSVASLVFGTSSAGFLIAAGITGSW